LTPINILDESFPVSLLLSKIGIFNSSFSFVLLDTLLLSKIWDSILPYYNKGFLSLFIINRRFSLLSIILKDFLLPYNLNVF